MSRSLAWVKLWHRVAGSRSAQRRLRSAGVTDIVIKGNDGADIINVADINITGNLNANGNAGTDSVSLQSLLADTTIGGGVVLFGGGGVDDAVSVLTESGSTTDLTIGAGLNLQNNGGIGGIRVNAFGTGDISIGGGLLVNETSVALAPGRSRSALMAWAVSRLAQMSSSTVVPATISWR
jgi:hypothetical protein